MKEAYWGALVILLGLFGIVVVNLFQNVTVDNDRVYYIIKESTEASAYDAIDLTYYRLKADLRMVEDKFVENLTRRFAENVTIGDYTIVVQDLNEVPPKISLTIRSGITSLQGEKFGIVNRVDAILETKYKLEDVLKFLNITEEEWIRYREVPAVTIDSDGKSVCKTGVGYDDPMCMPGDIEFLGFKDISLKSYICPLDKPERNVERDVEYRTCECGKWVEGTATVKANPVKSGDKYVYTWTFRKTGKIRSIEESIKYEMRIGKCVEGITLQVPKDLKEDIEYTGLDATSTDPHSSTYIDCPKGGIKILQGSMLVLKPKYKPIDTEERNAGWSSSNEKVIEILGLNKDGIKTVRKSCTLNEKATNCLASVTINAKTAGESTITLTSERNHKSTCKITVWDGRINGLSCKDLKVTSKESKNVEIEYTPTNAVNKSFEYSLADTDIASINSKNGLIKAKKTGKTTITVKEKLTKIEATCNLETEMVATEITCPTDFVATNTGTKFVMGVKPSDAVTSFTYKSKNTNIATIDKNGKVTAVKSGNTKIDVEDTISGLKKSCPIDTKILATKLTCPKNFVATSSGTTLVMTITPSDAETSFTYTSKNTKIATVNKSGKVTAVKTGNTKITVKDSNSGIEKECDVSAEVTSLTCPKTTFKATTTAKQFVVTSSPKGAETKLSYTIKDTKIATVDKNGYVTAVKTGKTKITVTDSTSGSTVTCDIEADDGTIPVTGVSCTDKKIYVNTNNNILETSYTPTNATPKPTLSYKSSDESIATISTTGVVKGLKQGTATITVTASGIPGTCTVTVNSGGSSTPPPAETGACAPQTLDDLVYISEEEVCLEYQACVDPWKNFSETQCMMMIGKFPFYKDKDCVKTGKKTKTEQHTYTNGQRKKDVITKGTCVNASGTRPCREYTYCLIIRDRNEPDRTLQYVYDKKYGEWGTCGCELTIN